jgi:hypothetical protein
VPLIATVHTQVAALFVTSFGLAMRPVPQEFSLASAKLMMMWHSASDNVPVNRWMRSLIATALANTRAKSKIYSHQSAFLGQSQIGISRPATVDITVYVLNQSVTRRARGIPY